MMKTVPVMYETGRNHSSDSPARLSNKSLLIGVSILAVVVLLTFGTIFKNINKTAFFDAIKSIPPVIIPLGLCLVLAYSFFEGVNIYRALKIAGYRSSLFRCWKYAIVGFFYSGITPSSSGGQPMQIYYMYQDHIRVSDGLLAVIMHLFGHEGAIVCLGLTGFCVLHGSIMDSAGYMKYLIILGILLHTLYFLFLLVILFTERGISIVSHVLLSILGKIDCRKGRITTKVSGILDSYRSASKLLKKNWRVAWKAILTGCFQFLCLFSIHAIIYAGFGLSGQNWATIILLQAVIFLSTGFIPIPGSAGVSEGLSLLLYQIIYPTALVGSAVLIGRCLSMYFCILLYFVILMVIRCLQRSQTFRQADIRHE